MRLKFDKPEYFDGEESVAYSIFGVPYLKTKKVEVIQAEIKIKCNLEKWKKIKKTFLDLMWVWIEKKYIDANWCLTIKYNCDESYKIDGEYMIVYKPFVIGEEL